jgi:HAD superfamily hydrolase (TIGR01458 family)
MAAILLDVDGVLHVSGEAIPGAADAVDALRGAGHRLRFVTNNTIRSRRCLTEELRGLGIAVEDDELQTTPIAAARTLRGRRVLALTMTAIKEDMDGIEFVEDDAEAVLLGGADETAETGDVFSYGNLTRAFNELGNGADLYCLHRNRWWQAARGPLLDAGAFVVGLEYAARRSATVLGKPSATYFAAALAALGSDASDAWMVGDDIEADIGGAQEHGLRTVLVRTGKFRADLVEASGVRPDGTLPSVASLPEWLERHAV